MASLLIPGVVGGCGICGFSFSAFSILDAGNRKWRFFGPSVAGQARFSLLFLARSLLVGLAGAVVGCMVGLAITLVCVASWTFRC